MSLKPSERLAHLGWSAAGGCALLMHPVHLCDVESGSAVEFSQDAPPFYRLLD